MPLSDKDFDRLYTRLAGKLYSYLISLVRGRSHAEDLLQETFLAALADSNAVNRPDGWWFRVARNKAFNHLRSRKRKREVIASAADGLGTDSSDGPLALLMGSESTIHLGQALERLDPDKREALQLRYLAGLSSAETGEILGIPEGTVRSRCHHGLARLKESLQSFKTRGNRP